MLYKSYRTTSAICYFYNSGSKKSFYGNCLSLCVDPVLATLQCYLPELWKFYILNVELYMSTIICTRNSFYFKFWKWKAGNKGNKTKQELAFRYYHSSALLTAVAMF